MPSARGAGQESRARLKIQAGALGSLHQMGVISTTGENGCSTMSGYLDGGHVRVEHLLDFTLAHGADLLLDNPAAFE